LAPIFCVIGVPVSGMVHDFLFKLSNFQKNKFFSGSVL